MLDLSIALCMRTRACAHFKQQVMLDQSIVMPKSLGPDLSQKSLQAGVVRARGELAERQPSDTSALRSRCAEVSDLDR